MSETNPRGASRRTGGTGPSRPEMPAHTAIAADEATKPRRRRSHRDLVRDDRGRIDIKALDLDALRVWVVDELGEKKFRAQQIYQWLWQKDARTFGEMTNISKAVRSKLDEIAYISFLETDTVLHSRDGTTKYLWKLEDGSTIESVLIPDEDRLTLCISSQVGCAMACTFCLTGDLGFRRHLKASEIANQPLQVSRDLPEGTRITNLVLMGMGEPLHNIDNLVPALRRTACPILRSTSPIAGSRSARWAWCRRCPSSPTPSRSTSPCRLNATTEEQRRQIMPITPPLQRSRS